MSFPPYPRYKPSGVEWLGDVPEHWEVKPLKAVCSHNDEVLGESTPPELLIDYVEISDVEAGRGIVSRSTMLFAEAPSRARRVVRDGDVLVSTVRTYLRAIAPVPRASESLIASTGFAVLRPRQIEASFLGYLCQAEYLISGVIARSIGVSYPAINASELVRLNVPVPVREEQQRITSFLDRETAKIDALVEEQQRLISLLKEKRQAVIMQAVTKGLDSTVPVKPSGIEWLGDVSAHWNIQALKWTGRFKAGAGFPDDEQGVEGEEFSFHKVNALGRADAQGLLLPSENTVSQQTAERLRAYVFPKGSIVFAKIGAALLLGRIRRLREPACIDNNMMGLMPFPDHDEEFIAYAMTLIRFDLIANPGTVPSLNESQIAEVRLAFPPLPEQKAIVTSLKTELAKFDQLIWNTEAALELLAERRSALISAAVTGKIDVRKLANLDASSGNASKLEVCA